MRLLLDTHIFLWFAGRPSEIERETFLAIEDPANDVYISAAVAWEIAMKHSKKKLTLPLEPALYLPARIKDFGFRSLPITQEHALTAATLRPIHADPFDRIQIAQAQIEAMVFVTRHRHALAYPLETLYG